MLLLVLRLLLLRLLLLRLLVLRLLLLRLVVLRLLLRLLMRLLLRLLLLLLLIPPMFLCACARVATVVLLRMHVIMGSRRGQYQARSPVASVQTAASPDVTDVTAHQNGPPATLSQAHRNGPPATFSQARHI